MTEKIQSFVTTLFSGPFLSTLEYHNLAHTVAVVENALLLAEQEGVSGEDLRALEFAAWFHDTGYSVSLDNHEQESSRLARRRLTEWGVEESLTVQVEQLIMATEVKQMPQNLLEEIIKDADLAYLGTTWFHANSEKLRLERNRVLGLHVSEAEWMNLSLSFMMEHRYFTPSARDKFGTKKDENIRELQAMISRL